MWDPEWEKKRTREYKRPRETVGKMEGVRKVGRQRVEQRKDSSFGAGVLELGPREGQFNHM